MHMHDKTTNVSQLKDCVDRFTKERKWGKHHTLKNLALSIAIEAAELMEHFQWDDLQSEDKEGIRNELADVMIYCLHFANVSGIDIACAIEMKLEKLNIKYPAELFSSGKAGSKEFWEIKKAYRAKQETDIV